MYKDEPTIGVVNSEAIQEDDETRESQLVGNLSLAITEAEIEQSYIMIDDTHN